MQNIYYLVWVNVPCLLNIIVVAEHLCNIHS